MRMLDELRYVVCAAIVALAQPHTLAGAPASAPASEPQAEVGTITSLVEGFNKTRDKQARAQVLEQLKGHKEHWEQMFLAASDMHLALGNEVLMPMLAAPGRSVIPKIVELLTWNPDASLAVAVKVTQRIGDEAIPSLVEQYKRSAPLLVRRYVAISAAEILAGKEVKKADVNNEILQWAMTLSAEKDESIARSSIRIMRSLFTEESSDKIEPILKAKLKDANAVIRMVAIDALVQVRPKADYVKEHVRTSALKSKDIVERDVNLRLCAKLPESDDALNALYECSFDKEARIRDAAAQTLNLLGPKALPLAEKMLKKLQQGNADSLPAILAVLKYSKENWASIEEALAKLLSSDNVRTRSLSLDFLASRPSLKDDTIRKMADLLDDSDKHIRMLAVSSLHPFAQKKSVREAIVLRRDRETDKGVKQMLDMFAAEGTPSTHPTSRAWPLPCCGTRSMRPAITPWRTTCRNFARCKQCCLDRRSRSALTGK